MYQNVAEMTTQLVGEKLTELKVKPSNVISIDFILGGNHWKDAFCLCFRIVITMSGGKMHYVDYGGAGTVMGKDMIDVLEKSIMPWLTEDLKTIHKSKLLMKVIDESGEIVCMFVDEESEIDYAPDCHIIHHVEIYNTGDLKWMAMLLGISDMSNKWCIFCHLRELQWSVIGHDRGELWTI